MCERSPIKNHRSTKRWLIRLHYIKQSSVWQRVALCRIQSGWIATIHIPNKSHQENETQCGGNVLRWDETLLWGGGSNCLDVFRRMLAHKLSWKASAVPLRAPAWSIMYIDNVVFSVWTNNLLGLISNLCNSLPAFQGM